MFKDSIPQVVQRSLIFIVLLLFIYLSFSILKYFIIPILWAIIIAYITWPLYRKLQKKIGLQHKIFNASLMLFLFMAVIGLPFLCAFLVLQQEVQTLFHELYKVIFLGPVRLPSSLQHIPMVSEFLEKMISRINENPEQFRQNLITWLQTHSDYGRSILNEFTQRVFYLFCTLISLFFLYKDGGQLLQHTEIILHNWFSDRFKPYLSAIMQTTHAVIYGIGFTAFIQSLLAGLSYVVVGIPNAFLMTLLTFILAFIPLGTPICYGSIALWLISQNQATSALIVFLWGCFIVTPSSNIIRPLFISKTTNIPFLIIMFGVIGGIASFGFLGIILGPVILALLLAIWKAWLQKSNTSMNEN